MPNFFEALGIAPTQPAAPPQPTLTPEWFAGMMNAPAQPAAPAAPEIPQQIESNAPPFNIMEALNGGVPNAAPPVAAPAMSRQPRERRSVLDTVGRLADVFAKVGGADALYQPTLDARQDRAFAIEDRTRGIDLDALKTALVKQQITTGGQQIEAGENALTDHTTGKLALGVRGLQAIAARGGDPAKAWPILAQQLGIEPERAAVIGEAIAKDPNSLYGLNAALNDPVKQGSQAKELQIYELMKKSDPATAELYLKGLANPDSITPYQSAQLRIATEKLGIDREIAASTIEKNSQKVENEGADLTKTQRGAVRQTLESIPGIRRTLQRVGTLSKALQDQGTIASGPLGGRIPGQLAGGTAAQYDKAEGLLKAQIRTLIRTTGEGSMSDYESKLNAITSPSRADSNEGRAEAIANLESLLVEIEEKAKRMIGNPSRAPAGGGGGGAPRKLPPRVRPSNAPTPPKVGAVMDGYRYKGGNLGDRKNWEKVQ